MAELVNTASDAVTQDYDRLRDDSGLMALEGHSALVLAGEDRKGWLQGQVTNDVKEFTPGTYIPFCVCEPTGHLISVVDAWAVADRFLLSVPTPTLGPLKARFEHNLILEDVQVEDLSGLTTLVTIQGPTATAKLGDLVQLPTLDAGEAELAGEAIYLMRANRTGLGGWDLWLPRGAKKAMAALKKAVPTVSAEAFDIARLEAGVPVFGRDMDTKTMPPELGPAFETRHVSYGKGCYAGQEVLMRIHSRGHANRKWVGLVSERPLEVGAAVSHPLRAEAGRVTSAAFSPDYGYIGAAMVRIEVAYEGERVQAATASGEVEAEVRQMPILRLD